MLGNYISDEIGGKKGLGDRIMQLTCQAIPLCRDGGLFCLFIQVGILHRHTNLLTDRAQQGQFLSGRLVHLPFPQNKEAQFTSFR